MSGAQLLLVVALAVPSTLFTTDANADGTSTSVTFLGCPGDGQAGSVPAPSAQPVPANATRNTPVSLLFTLASMAWVFSHRRDGKLI